MWLDNNSWIECGLIMIHGVNVAWIIIHGLNVA